MESFVLLQAEISSNYTWHEENIKFSITGQIRTTPIVEASWNTFGKILPHNQECLCVRYNILLIKSKKMARWPGSNKACLIFTVGQKWQSSSERRCGSIVLTSGEVRVKGEGGVFDTCLCW